jgi:hypothetical protein
MIVADRGFIFVWWEMVLFLRSPYYLLRFVDLQFYITKLINSMEERNSLEADIRSATKEIPCILWKPKIHCRNNKSHPLILTRMNPIKILAVFFADASSRYLPIMH